MFARFVSMNLKPNSSKDFTRTIEDEVLPLLRKQNGFQDEITFVASGGSEAIGISLWERKEDAENYSSRNYPDVVKVLGKVIEGTPRVQTYEVSNSTLHNIAARRAA